ncbi:MAG: hypothetical protein WC864_01510 [Ilumatobacteraceae bacterium]
MQTEAPPLLSVLRSRLQAELLTIILLNPDREWTLTELAKRVKGSISSAQRRVAEAERTGVVKTRRLGNTRLVKARQSPLTAPLTELLLRSFGPKQVVEEEFSGINGVKGLYIFGSWAARYLGVEGRPPNDIDVLVIGEPDRNSLDDAAQQAEERLARDVNVIVRSEKWWQDGVDGFHDDIRNRPLVPIMEEKLQ